ncbi:ethanolamine utilization polyhedral-body-like protein EutK [Klebsiella oxytoca]|nr:ethanolamine utilization polyhedral-body-like protein EutK [Klebsiella oxytoca]
MPLPMPFWILPVIQSSARKGEAMINALGLLEVDGMVAAVDAADAMLKAANVRLLSHEVLDPGRLTLVVEGDLAACRRHWMPEALRRSVRGALLAVGDRAARKRTPSG